VRPSSPPKPNRPDPASGPEPIAPSGGSEQIGRCELIDLDDVAGDRPVDEDVVVVVDVIRAFTTAVVAVDGGASSVHCVAGLEEARRLARAVPGSVLMGEERGARPEGFDAGNSPFDLAELDLVDRAVVQRTSNGTRGLVRFAAAPVLVAAAAVNAGATGRWLRHQDPTTVLIVATGTTSEDRACGRYIAAIVEGGRPDPDELAVAIRATAPEHIESWSRARGVEELGSFRADVEACARVDESATVLRGRVDGRAVVLRAVT
jgi:2-phosphosulfolactate phosphatase